MPKILISVVVLVIIVGVLAALAAKLKGAGGVKPDRYVLRKVLFTAAERSFLGVLDSVLPSNVAVFGKVRLADIFAVRSGLDRSERASAQNQINSKHVDFLLVWTSDLAPLAGIELDDSSHEEEERQQRDAFVDEVYASGGLPLLHVPAQKNYNPAELKAKVAALITSK
jgi:hypothetical protein